MLVSACSLGTSTSELATGTVHVIAHDRRGDPADAADVLVHSDSGQLVMRGVTGADGTLDIGSVDNASVTVVIHGRQDTATVVGESGALMTFAAVPLDATLHVGHADPADGAQAHVDLELPALTPEAEGYFVSVGCGREQLFVSRSVRVTFPAACGATLHTVVAKAHQRGTIGAVAASVLHGVDLLAGHPVEMPAWQPFETVAIDLVDLDAEHAITSSGVAVVAEAASYGPFGAARDGGHILAKVPGGSWDETRYAASLWYSQATPETKTSLELAEAGAPHAVTLDSDDFLTPPIADPDTSRPFSFLFEGNPDYRSIYLSYSCAKCSNSVHWELFAPPGPDPIELPELPRDLRSVSPEYQTIHYIVGEIFDASELDGYAAWLGSDLRLAPGATHRSASITLKADFDDGAARPSSVQR